MNKNLMFLFLVLFLSFVSSASLPDQDLNANVLVYQICQNSTYANLTSITYGNITYYPETAMTEEQNDYYTFYFSNTSNYGTYIVTTHCDIDGVDTIASYDFRVGEDVGAGKGVVQLGLLGFLIILFTLALVGIFKFEDYKGRFALYWVCHVLAVGIFFSAWQMGVDMGILGVAGVFKTLFYVTTFSILPMVFLSVAWVFYIHTMNDTIKGFMGRGMDEDEAVRRFHNRRKR